MGQSFHSKTGGYIINIICFQALGHWKRKPGITFRISGEIEMYVRWRDNINFFCTPAGYNQFNEEYFLRPLLDLTLNFMLARSQHSLLQASEMQKS